VPRTFAFSPEEEAFRREVRTLLRDEIAPELPSLREAAEKHAFPRALVDRLARRGLLGLAVPREWGGAGRGEAAHCIALEELGRLDASLATIVGAHAGIGTVPILLHGTDEQRARWLPDLASGRRIAAFALTEPAAGSDAASLRTRARREGDAWVLSGSKLYVTNGDVADTLVVFAATREEAGPKGITAFVVERPNRGVRVGAVEDKLGIRASTTAELVFEDCRVPAGNVLGEVDRGFAVALTALDGGRVALAAGVLGGALSLLERCAQRLRGRALDGESVEDRQADLFRLADMAADTHVGLLATYQAAALVEEYYGMLRGRREPPAELRRSVSRQAAIVKVFASEAASRAAERALAIEGLSGLADGRPVERALRDAPIGEIFEGTNDIQRLIVARSVLSDLGVGSA